MSGSAETGIASRAVRVLTEAAAAGRLGSALLLQGKDGRLLEAVATRIADLLLSRQGYAVPVEQHADFLVLRPSGKMRLIRIGESASEENTVRHLIHRIQLAPSVGERKVAVVHDADCFNGPSANAFLKTLEEPPADTTILLLTTRPEVLLATLRSRCQAFTLPADPGADRLSGAAEWRARFQEWLARLDEGRTGPEETAAQVLGAYSLVASALSLIQDLTDKDAAASGPSGAQLDEEEAAAVRQGIALGLRQRFLAEVALGLREFARERLRSGDREDVRRKVSGSLAELEEAAALLRYNLSEGAALEFFFLQALRIWHRRPE